MKELADILCAYEQARAAGINVALATVVRVEGSAYRREGARMLITGDGRIVGGVSGGCLERDVVQRAGSVMSSGPPVLVRYDTALDPENGTGYTLGCGGAVDVLIESLNTPIGIELMGWLNASRLSRQVICTVISKQKLGRRIGIDEGGNQQGDVGDGILSSGILQDAANVLRDGRSKLACYPSASGRLHVFMEYLQPPLDLIIFGAGNDAAPLAAFAKTLGWRVTVVDVRSAAMDVGRTWDADVLLRCRVDEIGDRVVTTATTAAVVMTHNFSHDRQVVGWLMSQPLMYLGVLGARHRTNQLLAELGQKSAGLHSPVGLDLGAEAPEEVALSIVAEITAVMHGRSGSPLKNRPGPIHAATLPREPLSCPVAAL